jgi:carboxypeptidase D
MAPYDVPDVAHDMILRFMGMDFSAIVDGSARIPSAIGDDAKPIFMDSGDVPLSSSLPGKTPEQTKAQWDGDNNFLHTGTSADSVSLSAYYNAGSVVLIFLLLAIAIGLCIWCHLRRRPVRLLRNPQSEENIPLNGYDDEQARRKRKGKERALENESGTAIFDVGEDEEEYVSDDVRKGRID